MCRYLNNDQTALKILALLLGKVKPKRVERITVIKIICAELVCMSIKYDHWIASATPRTKPPSALNNA